MSVPILVLIAYYKQAPSRHRVFKFQVHPNNCNTIQ